MKPIACLSMKQNCHFDRDLAQHKHATPSLSFSGIITTLLGLCSKFNGHVYSNSILRFTVICCTDHHHSFFTAPLQSSVGLNTDFYRIINYSLITSYLPSLAV